MREPLAPEINPPNYNKAHGENSFKLYNYTHKKERKLPKTRKKRGKAPIFFTNRR